MNTFIHQRRQHNTHTHTNTHILRRYKNIYKIDRRQNYRRQQNQRIIYLRDQRTLKFTKNTTKTNIAACANTISVKLSSQYDLKALDMQQHKIHAEEVETL